MKSKLGGRGITRATKKSGRENLI